MIVWECPLDKNRALDEIRKVLIARQPLISVISYEEERVEATLKHVARTILRNAPFHTWAVTTGLDRAGGETCDPIYALDVVAADTQPSVYLFLDLHVYFDDPVLVRKLRDIRRLLKGKGRHIFMQSPPFKLPTRLRRDVHTIQFPLPTTTDLEHVLDRRLTAANLVFSAERRLSVITALRGLTINEAGHALNAALYNRDRYDPAIIHSLHEQKAQLARKDGVLEFVPQRWSLRDIGGLVVLKSWLRKRRKLFEDDSEEVAAIAPRGVLIMGIPGCGKSMSIKAISAHWRLPLFRLDMGQVFSGVNGGPEESFARALRMMEQVAPAILWIDEIENGISADSSGADAGIKGRIFATFLTWMQEKPQKVFVAATANRIDLLPAELLRKGRFDQVFFIDLPTEAERVEIFRVHMRRRGIEPSPYNPVTLAKATKNWNGAEIEQCVVASMTDAYAEGVEMTVDHIYTQIGAIVPLSKTMAEQIKGIRSWALQRALGAS